MDAIEQRARELLAKVHADAGWTGLANEIRLNATFDIDHGLALAAIRAALTLPEGYVMVQETQLRHLLSDAITSVEFIAGRGQSKPLSRRVSDQAWALVESMPARRKVP
ncbi:hypothetical protein N7676_08555 [Stenotrophomonas sp. GD03993]|uniref:hypothetical protein n=1 Tax=unclassified Stenotrophomonas TaxID=196198 RepID=UPI0013133C9B|nr:MULTISPECIES: hypothetical protein [unclassified Stenotrophomonas]MDH0188173.1 hypothetical protein [Stenotrophomonas sp. GD04051]MDH0463856.1 hypothetical protein [Stenotrophomonas sp. GD03993]MDH0876693.1 hypothetical protein [Stenotrophomonas sp. GD03877]MDH2155633.1 hypothetical protein [Stenotrophomonas sp. GD03657]